MFQDPNELAKRPERYKGYSWTKYVDIIEKDGTYGDNQTLKAMSDLLEITIRVLLSSPDGCYIMPDIEPNSITTTSKYIYLGFLSEGHYEVIKPLQSGKIYRF